MEENKYRIHFRIATDVSDVNPDTFLSLFRDFIRGRIPDYKYTIAGYHTEHCKFPHIHFNILTEQPEMKSFRHHWLNYLKKQTYETRPKGNQMVISWKKIQFKEYNKKTTCLIDNETVPIEMTYEELVNVVMGYPLKERKPLDKYISGYTKDEVQDMMNVASAGWDIIRKAKDKIEEKEKKARSERELLYEYLGKNLKLTYTNKFKDLKLYPGQHVNLDKVMQACEDSAPVDPIKLHRNAMKLIIRFYKEYDHTKAPNRSNLQMKALRYLLFKDLVDEEQYLEIIE